MHEQCLINHTLYRVEEQLLTEATGPGLSNRGEGRPGRGVGITGYGRRVGWSPCSEWPRFASRASFRDIHGAVAGRDLSRQMRMPDPRCMMSRLLTAEGSCLILECGHALGRSFRLVRFSRADHLTKGVWYVGVSGIAFELVDRISPLPQCRDGAAPGDVDNPECL